MKAIYVEFALLSFLIISLQAEALLGQDQPVEIVSIVVETFLIGKGSNTESFVPRDSEFPIKNSVGGDSIEDWHWKNRIYPIDTRWDILDICKWLCWCLT